MKEKRLLSLLLAVMLSIVAFAQNQTFTGTVVDANGEPVIGATIVQKGTSNTTVTDIDGNFSINAPAGAELEITYVGYAKQTVPAGNNMHIIITEDSELLNELVVIGYGVQKKSVVTASIAKVSSEDLAGKSRLRAEDALKGMAAGVNVISSSGQPGSQSMIRIRGIGTINNSNPLYIIDGMPTDQYGMESVNPNDIESIEVLKDVSATAIYGSRGANGVILITTKKGKVGEKKAHISYGYSLGLSSVSKHLDLLNASEWAQFQKTYFSNKGGYTDEQIKALGEGTDWQDAVLRTAVQQAHELSVNGSTDKSRYAFSANYTDQDGIVLNTGFQRYNFHTNVEWELQKNLKFGINATYGRSKQQGFTTTEEQVFNSSPFSAGITNSFVYALLMPPVISVRNADGSYNFTNPYEYAYFAIGDHAANPVYDLKESVAENVNNYLLSNVWASYKLGDFTLKATVGLSSEKLTQNYFSGAYTSLGLATQGIGGTGNRQTDVWQQEYTLSYQKEFGIHQIDALAGYTKQNSTSTHSAIRTNHFTNETLKQYNLGDGANIYTPKTGISESDLNSLIARVNYTLLDRYNATATFRADRSSRFAKNHRWGYFPSLGLSWNVDKENFLANARHLDYLKVRLTGGLVGNQEIPDYAFTTSYATGSYAGSSSYAKKNTANDNLKWETTASYNLGTDLGLYNGRLNFVLDLYYKKTSDLLLDVPMGFANGVTSQLQNVGNVENKGIELAVNGTLLKRRHLLWTASANIAHNHNEITNMGKTNNVLQGADSQQILRKGEALGSFYGLQFAGIVQQGEDVSQLPTINGLTPKAGDAKFVDANHDSKIDGNDRVILGSVQPDLTYGFSTQLQVREWDFSATFAGSHGAKLYNALGRRLEQTGDSYNVLSTVKDAWTAEKGGNSLPLPSTSRPFSYIDSRYVQSASYLKLRNLTVGYRPRLPKSLPLSLRIYATATNLFTITPYKGYDPEVSRGTDSGAYPSARTFTFGVSITL